MLTLLTRIIYSHEHMSIRYFIVQILKINNPYFSKFFGVESDSKEKILKIELVLKKNNSIFNL